MDSFANKPNTGHRPTSCRKKTFDFMNVFKAFIGSGFLGFPFQFQMSGLVLGGVTLAIIVIITDHCCQLMVKCKKYLVEELMEQHNSDNDDGSYRDHLEKNLRYADVGKFCFGKAGIVIVDFFLLLTQTGFSIIYFIFLGNTLHAMFPVTPVQIHSGPNASVQAGKFDRFAVSLTGEEFRIHDNIKEFALGNKLASDLFPVEKNGSTTNTTTTIPASSVYSTQPVPTTSFKTPSTAVPANHSFMPASNISDIVYMSTAPDLIWLMFVPLLPFILFAYIRNIRRMGPVSFIANIAIWVGYITILAYMLVGFKLDPVISLANWSTFPIFFGAVCCAFEGIGLVLPVEASMEENRHAFKAYLHGALFLVALILASFGVVGYLRFGPHTQQVITRNLDSSGALTLSIDVCLIIAVGFTYPLQIFPVLEILERYLFGIGKADVESDVPKIINYDESDSPEETEEQEQELLLPASRLPVREVAEWKRYLMRTIVVLLVAGLSIVLRHNFAYVSSLIGSLGSSALAYILPCLFHIKMRGKNLHPLIILKDLLIIFIGLAGGICGAVIVIMQIIKSFEVHH